jgi:hypothetical protein
MKMLEKTSKKDLGDALLRTSDNHPSLVYCLNKLMIVFGDSTFLHYFAATYKTLETP